MVQYSAVSVARGSSAAGRLPSQPLPKCSTTPRQGFHLDPFGLKQSESLRISPEAARTSGKLGVRYSDFEHYILKTVARPACGCPSGVLCHTQPFPEPGDGGVRGVQEARTAGRPGVPVVCWIPGGICSLPSTAELGKGCF